MPINNISTSDLVNQANELGKAAEEFKAAGKPKSKGIFNNLLGKGHSLNDTTKSTKSHSVKQTDNVHNKSESSISKFFDVLKADIKQIAQDFKSETKKLGNFFRAVGFALEKLNDSLDKADDKKDVQLAFKKFTVDYKLARGLLNLGESGKAAYKEFSEGHFKKAIDNLDKQECKGLISALTEELKIQLQKQKHNVFLC